MSAFSRYDMIRLKRACFILYLHTIWNNHWNSPSIGHTTALEPAHKKHYVHRNTSGRCSNWMGGTRKSSSSAPGYIIVPSMFARPPRPAPTSTLNHPATPRHQPPWRTPLPLAAADPPITATTPIDQSTSRTTHRSIVKRFSHFHANVLNALRRLRRRTLFYLCAFFQNDFRAEIFCAFGVAFRNVFFYLLDIC